MAGHYCATPRRRRKHGLTTNLLLLGQEKAALACGHSDWRAVRFERWCLAQSSGLQAMAQRKGLSLHMVIKVEMIATLVRLLSPVTVARNSRELEWRSTTSHARDFIARRPRAFVFEGNIHLWARVQSLSSLGSPQRMERDLTDETKEVSKLPRYVSRMVSGGLHKLWLLLEFARKRVLREFRQPCGRPWR